MASRPIVRRLAAFATAAVLVVTGATTALANVANPSGGIDVTHPDFDTISLSGTWTWPDMKFPCTDRWVGWAVDWGDSVLDAPVGLGLPTALGNRVGSTNWYVGTPDDNTVHTNMDCGVSSAPDVNSKGKSYVVGTWGPIEHQYAIPGEYKVCVLMYDIHLKRPRRGHSDSPTPASATELIAGGSTRRDHNHDNSAEENGLTPFLQEEGGPCTTVFVGEQ